MIFSAIAMMAFVGTSMAHNVAKDETAPRDCDQEGINARDCAYETLSITWAEAEQVGDCVTEKCYEETKVSGGGGGGILLPVDPRLKA